MFFPVTCFRSLKAFLIAPCIVFDTSLIQSIVSLKLPFKTLNKLLLYIPLLYNALILLVWSWSVPISFWNPLSILPFWVQNKTGRCYFLYFLHYFHHTSLHIIVNLFSVHVFLKYLLDFNEICASLYGTLQV